MAKQSGMLLVIAALLVVGLIGFLFFSPCGVTIENFEDTPAEPTQLPPVLSETPEPAPAPAPAPTPAPTPAQVQAIKGPRPVPQPPAAPQPLPEPVAAPTKVPVPPTPASSAAALTLTPVQCSALCPVTQESCESKFSCQTKLAPIGVAPMSMTSTPAPITTIV